MYMYVHKPSRKAIMDTLKALRICSPFLYHIKAGNTIHKPKASAHWERNNVLEAFRGHLPFYSDLHYTGEKISGPQPEREEIDEAPSTLEKVMLKLCTNRQTLINAKSITAKTPSKPASKMQPVHILTRCATGRERDCEDIPHGV